MSMFDAPRTPHGVSWFSSQGNGMLIRQSCAEEGDPIGAFLRRYSGERSHIIAANARHASHGLFLCV